MRVLNMHTIKPLDREAILQAAAETRGIVTAEEHHLTGGLGGAVAELLAVEHPTRMRLVGMPDDFAVVGPTVPLRAKYGMSAEAIVAACRSLLTREGSMPRPVVSLDVPCYDRPATTRTQQCARAAHVTPRKGAQAWPVCRMYTRDELDAEGQEIYDRIRRDRNAPEVGLQFRALLHSPKATELFDITGSTVAFPECYAGESEGAGDYPGGP